MFRYGLGDFFKNDNFVSIVEVGLFIDEIRNRIVRLNIIILV